MVWACTLHRRSGVILSTQSVKFKFKFKGDLRVLAFFCFIP